MTAPQLKNLYGFVVLHYNNYADTIACVNSILNIAHRDDYHIIIVDNASPNNSFGYLQKEFEGYSKVTLVLTTENKGYSGGNNVGIKRLKEMAITKIVIATNDTEIISVNLLDEFDKIDSDSVGIVGTDVIALDGEHQNPLYYKPTILYFLNLYFYSQMFWIRSRVYNCLPIVNRIRRSFTSRSVQKIDDNSSLMSRSSVYMLHGCFFYLTKGYVEKIGLLDENLFMYGEEDLLSWNCERYGLERIYLPNLRVLHKDGLSTKEVYKEGKEEFVRQMTIKSNQYLKKIIRKWPLIKILTVGGK
jgi:GT2 family glycosyltransferase